MMIIKRKRYRITLSIILYLQIVLVACSTSNGIYIDIKKGAIVSRVGKGLNEISIEDDSSDVTLRSSQSIIYFNKKNTGLAAQTIFNRDLVIDFDLTLKPKCTYKLRQRMGYDRGNFAVTFKTDSTGNVIMASNTNRNN
ncbi:MAG TPA: hypothetical protein VF500_14550 [Mucilaginibacter sp.]